MTPSIDERLEMTEKDIAVIKNELEHFKETMNQYAKSMKDSVSRIELAIEKKCNSDDERFKMIEIELKEQSRRLSPIAVVMISALVGVIGAVAGIMGAIIVSG